MASMAWQAWHSSLRVFEWALSDGKVCERPCSGPVQQKDVALHNSSFKQLCNLCKLQRHLVQCAVQVVQSVSHCGGNLGPQTVAELAYCWPGQNWGCLNWSHQSCQALSIWMLQMFCNQGSKGSAAGDMTGHSICFESRDIDSRNAR